MRNYLLRLDSPFWFHTESQRRKGLSLFCFLQRCKDAKVGVGFLIVWVAMLLGYSFTFFSQSFGAVLYLRRLELRAYCLGSFHPQAWNAILRPRYAILRPCSSFPQTGTLSLPMEVYSSTFLARNPSASLRNPSAVFFFSAALHSELAAACLLLHRLGRQSFGGVLYLRSLILRACSSLSSSPQAWKAILRWCSLSPQPCTTSLQTEVFRSTGLERNPSP